MILLIGKPSFSNTSYDFNSMKRSFPPVSMRTIGPEGNSAFGLIILGT
jgi:hypothetical protein